MSAGGDTCTTKAVMLVGGRGKGTRFRPLSVDIPKPLFPVAGYPILYHHIEACLKLPNMKEILLIGFYQQNEYLNLFIYEVQQQFHVRIRYLQEFVPLGTAGALYHFRDQIMAGFPYLFFVLNADICGDFPLEEMLHFHTSINSGRHFTILATEADSRESVEYGCIVEDPDTHEVMHYVEKPETFVSTSINCGIYLFTPEIFKHIQVMFLAKQEQYFGLILDKVGSDESIRLEKELFPPLAGTGKLFVFHKNFFWSQIKSPAAAIYANSHMLKTYSRKYPERLTNNVGGGPKILGDVYIHPTAGLHPSAVLGPNVSVGRHVTVCGGVRLRDCIILDNVVIRDHSCVIHAVVGWQTTIGSWCRIEGIPCDPNPDKPFAKLKILPVFNKKGQMNATICVIGSHAIVHSEIVVRNCIVLPHKELSRSYSNEIIL